MYPVVEAIPLLAIDILVVLVGGAGKGALAPYTPLNLHCSK